MSVISTQTFVKATKRNLRIWIEGAKLKKAGFSWHTRYTRNIENGVITYKVDANGELKTAGRERNGKEIPIIDLSMASIEGFQAGQQVTATFTLNKITIK